MTASYVARLKDAYAQRRVVSIPSFGWLTAALVVGVACYLALAVVAAPEGFAEKHFADERGAVTVLSAVCMALVCAFAGTAFFASPRAGEEGRWDAYFWLLAALGFGFFALDELLSFHERAGDWLSGSAVGPTQTFRNWNDLIVIGYGLAALPMLLAFLPEVLRTPRFAELLAVAFACYCLHTGIDAVVEPPTSTSIILEESAKVFSAAFFALAFFTGMAGRLTRSGVHLRGAKAPVAFAGT